MKRVKPTQVINTFYNDTGDKYFLSVLQVSYITAHALLYHMYTDLGISRVPSITIMHTGINCLVAQSLINLKQNFKMSAWDQVLLVYLKHDTGDKHFL